MLSANTVAVCSYDIIKSPSLKGGDSHGRIYFCSGFVVGDPARPWFSSFIFMVAKPEK